MRKSYSTDFESCRSHPWVRWLATVGEWILTFPSLGYRSVIGYRGRVNPDVPIPGLSSGDWLPWASESWRSHPWVIVRWLATVGEWILTFPSLCYRPVIGYRGRVNPDVPILGLSSGDWLPWASESWRSHPWVIEPVIGYRGRVNPDVPILGLSSGDWLPWASESWRSHSWVIVRWLATVGEWKG